MAKRTQRTETHDVNIFFHINADKKIVNRILDRIMKVISKEDVDAIEIRDEINVEITTEKSNEIDFHDDDSEEID